MERLTLLFVIVLGLTFGNVHASPPSAFCLIGDPASFNPELSSDESTSMATRPLYNRLVENRPTHRSRPSFILEPALAKSWRISKDQRTYTFHLRRGVHFQQSAYFSPSRNLNADDVLFTFNRQRLSAHPFHAVGGGGYPDFSALGLQRNLQEVEKVSDSVVRFHLNSPDPAFLSKLAMDWAAIFSAEYGEWLLSKGTAGELDLHPIGTGPFLLKTYESGRQLTYTANPSYFRGKVSPESLTLRILVPPSLRDSKVRDAGCLGLAQWFLP